MATIAARSAAASPLEAALLNVSRGSFADPDDVLRHALAEGAEGLGAARATAWKLDRGGSARLALRAIHTAADNRLPGNGTAAPPVAPATPGPAETWPRTWVTAADGSALSAAFWRSGVPTGLLHFESDDPDRVWTDAERLFAAALAEHIAAALDRIEKDRILHDRDRLLGYVEAVGGIGVWDWDVTNDTITWSAQQLMLHGLDDSTYPRRFDQFMQFVHPDHHDQVIRECEQLLKTHKPFTFEYRVMRPDGSVRWLLANGRLLNEPGRVRMVGTSQDITERVEAEAEAARALRESEESHRTIFELASEAIFVHDPDTGVVLDANRAACDLHGVTLEELKRVGIPGISDGEAPYDAAHVRELVQRAAAGEPQRFEWLGRHSSGRSVWIEVSLTGVTILGEKRVLATVRNITERKESDVRLHSAYAELEQRVTQRTEQLAQAKEAAEQANRAKSEFLSRMSHELRTPMNSILGFAQVLARSELCAQDARSVQHVLRAGRHLLQLINEVLDIARIESGRHALSLEPVRVESVIQEACGMVRPLSAQWSVNLEVSGGACTDLFVRADRQRLAQVMLNLLSNAIKYNRRGGTVRLLCSRTPTPDGVPDRLVIRVQDTGHGIPVDKVDQLFAPFNRLGAEQSEIEGTGLGLALSQRLTEAMGGTLALESTGSEGSVFRIDLEIAQSATEHCDDGADAAAMVCDDVHGPATLLYIEENLANLSLVETILLSRPKWRTLPALQGRIGLELAREHAPDLILLDLHLPDIHGSEVLRRLRLDESTAHIPVVVISADATQSTVERMLGAGAAAFIPKPLDIDEFLETIERLLPAAATGR